MSEGVNKLIDVVVERQWHIGPHAQAMEEAGWNHRILGGFPKSRYVTKGIPARHIHSFPVPALWNFFTSKTKLPQLGVDAPKLLARWAAKKARPNSVVVCYSTVYRHLFPLLRKKELNPSGGAHVLAIERGSTHPEAYFHAVEAGRREAGLTWEKNLPKDLMAEIEAGQFADFVIAGSNVIRDSYRSRGVPDERILTIAYGTDEKLFEYFTRPKTHTSRPLRIACVGIQGIRKGLWRLLKIGEWAQRRGIKMELHLVGPMEPEAPELISRFRVPVISHGVKKGYELAGILQSSDLYCLPSYEEGFGISVIEAMSTGLPAIVSEETGAREAITPGLDGLILGNYDDEYLDAVFSPILKDTGLRLRMGTAAREKVLQNYTDAHYGKRLRSEYERMFRIIDESSPGLKTIGELAGKSN